MAYIDLNDAIIAQVRQSADLVEFVTQVTPLKQAGKSYKGLCPFHREKTPSFQVDRDKGLFYCFGCGTGGDIFKFLSLTERYTFPEAVEHVAARVGIKLPTRKRSAKDDDKEDVLDALEQAAAGFQQALGWIPNAADAYLRKRDISEEIRQKYGFGYAPDSWDFLLTRLRARYSVQQLEGAGLILPRKGGDGHYDRFRNRLMIPIHSEGGSLIGFGGRTLDGSDPKYLNSPESIVFNKSNLLYNLHRAKDAMRRSGRAILVEGYFDAIALDYAGVPGVVASMGTSLTPGQASLLRRYSRRIVIAYDGDDAGRSAALRGAPILLSAGLSVDILDVGRGNDPDTLIQKDGLQGFMDALEVVQDVFSFALGEWVSNPSSLSTRDKSAHVEAFVPLLAAVADPVTRNDAAQRVADGLRLEFDTIWSRVRTRGSRQVERQPSAPISTGERQLLGALLQGKLPSAYLGKLREDFFEDPSCKTIFGVVLQRFSDGQALDFSEIATQLRSEADLTRLSELALSEDSDGCDLKALENTIRLMERRLLDRRLREIQIGIQEASLQGDLQREHSLLTQKNELSRQLHALK